MAGNKQGGVKARETNIFRYGAEYYDNLGRMGGSVSGIPKGFALQKKVEHLKASQRGGKASRRRKDGSIKIPVYIRPTGSTGLLSRIVKWFKQHNKYRG